MMTAYHDGVLLIGHTAGDRTAIALAWTGAIVRKA